MYSPAADPITRIGKMFCVPNNLIEQLNTLLQADDCKHTFQTCAVTAYNDAPDSQRVVMPSEHVVIHSDNAADALAAKIIEMAIPFYEIPIDHTKLGQFDISRIRVAP